MVGLVAAKLAENHYRPAVVGTQMDGYTRASCRSIPEFHITQALDECADLMERHGGHAMAAGFTVQTGRLEELMARLNAIARREFAEKDLCPRIHADLELPLKDLHPVFLHWLYQLQPTGTDNPDVAFISHGVRVIKARKVGAEGKHLKLTVTDGRITYDAIAFRLGYWADQLSGPVDLLYHFEKNVYNGRESLQLNVRDIKPAEL